jgi:AcrR family transcriptional regulator
MSLCIGTAWIWLFSPVLLARRRFDSVREDAIIFRMPRNGPDGGQPVVKRRTPTRRRGDSASTRESLLRAARDLGMTTSFFRVTVDDIAERAGTSRATFYLYFENKEDIYLQLAAVTTERFTRAIDSIEPMATPQETIKHAVRLYMLTFAEEASVLKVIYAVASYDQRFGEYMNRIRRTCHERADESLRLGTEKGYLRDVDAQPTARALVSMVESFCIRQIHFRQEEGMDFSIERSTSALSDVIIHALTENKRSVRARRQVAAA